MHSVFIMVTNFVLSFGGPLAVSVFLIVLSAAGENHLNTVWRVCFGIGIILPLTVFYFRMRMLSSVLYKKGAIKRESLNSVRGMRVTEYIDPQGEYPTGLSSRGTGRR